MKLISGFYQIAIDPLSFDDMLAEWDRLMRHTLEDGAGHVDDADLLEHSERAAAILQQMPGAEGGETSLRLADVIACDPNPAMLLDGSGEVVATNARAAAEFGVREGRSLEAIAGETVPRARLRRLVESIRAEDGAGAGGDAAPAGGMAGLVELVPPRGDEPVLFAVSRARCGVDAHVAGMVTALAPVWSANTLNVLREHFDLTPAEVEIIQLLTGGRNATEISHVRNTSLHTVRAQIKSILMKTRLDSQIDLVRHLGFLQRHERKPHEAAAGEGAAAMDAGAPPALVFLRENGKRLAYGENGPESGRPVLFLHGLIDNTTFPGAVLRQLHARNIRLIAPVRPSYGTSDPYDDPGDAPGEFADLAAGLMDRLGIASATVMGHMAGTFHAAALAARHPDRVTSILSVAGAVPMAHRWQYAGMTAGHRIAGLTARHAPLALPLLVRGGIRLLRLGREDGMLDLLFRDAPVDRALAGDPELSRLMFEKFHFVTRQGPQAFQTDLALVSGDWSELMESVSCPLTIVHGAQDKVVLIEGVRAFAERWPTVTLHEAPDAGQLVFYRETARVMDLLEPMLGGQVRARAG